MPHHFSSKVVFIMLILSSVSIFLAVKQFLILKDHVYWDTFYGILEKSAL